MALENENKLLWMAVLGHPRLSIQMWDSEMIDDIKWGSSDLGSSPRTPTCRNLGDQTILFATYSLNEVLFRKIRHKLIKGRGSECHGGEWERLDRRRQCSRDWWYLPRNTIKMAMKTLMKWNITLCTGSDAHQLLAISIVASTYSLDVPYKMTRCSLRCIIIDFVILPFNSWRGLFHICLFIFFIFY